MIADIITLDGILRTVSFIEYYIRRLHHNYVEINNNGFSFCHLTHRFPTQFLYKNDTHTTI